MFSHYLAISTPFHDIHEFSEFQELLWDYEQSIHGYFATNLQW